MFLVIVYKIEVHFKVRKFSKSPILKAQKLKSFGLFKSPWKK